MKRKPSGSPLMFPHIVHSACGAPPGKKASEGVFTAAAGIWVVDGHPPFRYYSKCLGFALSVICLGVGHKSIPGYPWR